MLEEIVTVITVDVPGEPELVEADLVTETGTVIVVGTVTVDVTVETGGQT